jgi:hypothetical protein
VRLYGFQVLLLLVGFHRYVSSSINVA